LKRENAGGNFDFFICCSGHVIELGPVGVSGSGDLYIRGGFSWIGYTCFLGYLNVLVDVSHFHRIFYSFSSRKTGT
jgi:hypothetical protein